MTTGSTPDNYEEADVVLVGVSRTSKTPTSIYLANRGIKTANIPLVPNVPLPKPCSALRNRWSSASSPRPSASCRSAQNRLASAAMPI